jgi:hypothetical protein
MGCSVCKYCKSNCYNDGLCPTCIKNNNKPKKRKKIKAVKAVDAEAVTNRLKFSR